MPAILFAAAVATAAGYLLVRASDEGSSNSDPSTGIQTTELGAVDTSPAADSDGGSPSTDLDSASSGADPSNLGKPIQVFSDALGDLDIDQVIDDWTPVDRPDVPGSTAEIEPAWVKNGRITVNLPDGFYWGLPVSTFDEDERGINFDIRQVFWGEACAARFGIGDDICLNDYQVVDTAGTQLYPSYLADLLYVSLAVYGDVYSESNMAVVPATYWSLLAAGQPVTVTIPNGDPDPPDVAIANSPFLLTIVNGSIIAAEGIWIP